MKFYHIKDDFIAFLHQFDSKVSDNKNESRPYVGVVLEVAGIKYYAPFSSPKPKHKKMKNGKDFRKINNGIYGAINFNNMIPVVDTVLIEIDIANIADIKYRRLLQNQYNYIRADESAILRTAENLRNMIFKNEKDISEHDKIIKQRCCNLPLLEKKYCEYKK
ncbi:MAG: type III toxin-antitoxin system ToxN/AbiQ family toxin [Treponema sp.]|jgi:protein AbiQ|nr:type III toxin-antitoxin system ToxN/AbiQ family toxin [Treponema sp.]MBR4246471.1 type III toxin-antitoxin system ToxN/AbiQ family toxin [Treponema sp.]MBR6143469.1 type III toxin-antitoxin system ToxN/AbiQ family toxin [Treponema sp.]